MSQFLWVLVMLAELGAGVLLVLTVLAAKGAPQEAAGAAMAAVIAIAPYCFARAFDEFTRRRP